MTKAQIQTTPATAPEPPQFQVLPSPPSIQPAAPAIHQSNNPLIQPSGEGIQESTNPTIQSAGEPAPKKRTRNGKIARLPYPERDMVNRMLRNNISHENIRGALEEHGIAPLWLTFNFQLSTCNLQRPPAWFLFSFAAKAQFFASNTQ